MVIKFLIFSLTFFSCFSVIIICSAAMSATSDSYNLEMDAIDDKTPRVLASSMPPPRRRSVFVVMKEKADQHSARKRTAAVIALAILPAVITSCWVYIPIEGGIVDHWALLLSTKIPITGAFWALTAYCLTSLASPPSWRVAITTCFFLVALTSAGQSLFLWMLISMHRFVVDFFPFFFNVVTTPNE